MDSVADGGKRFFHGTHQWILLLRKGKKGVLKKIAFKALKVMFMWNRLSHLKYRFGIIRIP